MKVFKVVFITGCCGGREEGSVSAEWADTRTITRAIREQLQTTVREIISITEIPPVPSDEGET